MNTIRQLSPSVCVNHTTSSGVNPPARCAPLKKIPCTVPRSVRGTQRENVRAALGHAPASPAPKRKRVTTSDVKLHAAAVNIVNADHHNTIRVSTCRVPCRSAHHAVGISNSA